MRLAAIAMDRSASAPLVPGPRVSELFFDFARGVTEFGDDAAIQTCLNSMKWLNETDRLTPRNSRDRKSLLELLWGGLGSEVYHSRESGLDALASIQHFGDLVELLGGDQVQELRRRIQVARWDAGREQLDDLGSAEELLR
jgi:hypothetical protein